VAHIQNEPRNLTLLLPFRVSTFAAMGRQALRSRQQLHASIHLPSWHRFYAYPKTDLSIAAAAAAVLFILPPLQPWAGKCCAAGSSCIRNNEWYYNCQPESTGSTPHTSNVKHAPQQQQQQQPARAAAPAPAPAVPARKSAGEPYLQCVICMPVCCNDSLLDTFVVERWCLQWVPACSTVAKNRFTLHNFMLIAVPSARLLQVASTTTGRCWACR
jgi:hypothetical protein